jgi:mevalonate pyrophosphate decarboxylase
MRESLPFSVLEAAANGCELILSNIPAHRSMGLECSYFNTVSELSSYNFDYDTQRVNGNLKVLNEKYGITSFVDKLTRLLRD